MSQPADPLGAPGQLHVALGLLVWRMREHPGGEVLTLSETSALARLAEEGRSTAADLARAEEIRPQSMGVTMAGLEARGLVRRRPDPSDRRRWLLSVTAAGRRALEGKDDDNVDRMKEVLVGQFTASERAALERAAPLLVRLAKEL